MSTLSICMSTDPRSSRHSRQHNPCQFTLMLEQLTCCVLLYYSLWNQSVPRFPLFMLFSFDFKKHSQDYVQNKQSACLLVVQQIHFLKMLLGKSGFCICNISKMKQTSVKKTEHCLTHLNKMAWEIWSVFWTKFTFEKNTQHPFPTESLNYCFRNKRLSSELTKSNYILPE